MKTLNIQNLHCHTTTSDGELSPLEVLETCQNYHVSAVAFTDHDSLPNEKTIDFLMNNKNHSVKWIVGVELNSGLPKDFSDEYCGGFDIVGLFVNPNDKKLIEHCQKAQTARLIRMKKTVKNLQNLGFEISENDCLKASGGESVGRPHMVKALKSKEINLKVIENLRFKMEKESLNNPVIKKKYDLMISSGENQYPYSLFLDQSSYIPNVYVEYEYWVDMDQAVELIRNAGGLAFIAHYFTLVNKLPPNVLEKIIKEKRIDGLETVFGRNLYGTALEEKIVSTRKITKALVEKYRCLESGGDDSHSAQSIIDFANNHKFANSTVGLAEKIIKLSKVNTQWSSF